MNIRMTILLGTSALLMSASVFAEWPDRPVKLILSQAAGSQPDILARVLGEKLGREWGQPVVVENRPGGNNAIGAVAAARAAPDGYTLYYATTAALVSNAYTFKSLPYDPAKDFTPVALVAKSPFVVAVNPKLPVRTYAELVAMDKAQPGKLSFASDGNKSFSGMLGEWLNRISGTSIVQVPYTNPAQSVLDTVSGLNQVVVQGTSTVLPFVQRGELRLLAVTTTRRLPGLDAVPTLAESIPGFEFVGWHGVVVPTGVAPGTVARINRDINNVLADPDFQSRLSAFQLIRDQQVTSQADFVKFIGDERGRWAAAVKSIGITPE